MILRLFIGLLLVTCEQNEILLPESADPSLLNTAPPIIKWISPRFDAIVNEKITIKCQIEDENDISSVELWADSSKLSNIEISAIDSIYTLIWYNRTYSNGSTALIHIKATDNVGNDTISQQVRLIIDDNAAYPKPVSLYPLDSILVNSTLSGYKINWWYSGDPYFKKYILEKSSDPLMIGSINIYITEDKSIISYDDYDISTSSISYYRLAVEDSFGKRTNGNVVSTSILPMPPQWEIESIQYTANSVIIDWENPSFDYYTSHQVLFSDSRSGTYKTLREYSDSLRSQYENEYSPTSENWFSILTQDSIGQRSISEPYMHPPPNEPEIDSVLYYENTFRIQWDIEPDIDFVNYQVLSTVDEDAFNLSEVQLINNQIEDTLHYNVMESQYYLFQVITNDAWGLQTRGPIISTSSFNKFLTTEENVSHLKSIFLGQEGNFISVGESNQSEVWILKYDVLGILIDSTNFSNALSEINDIKYVSDIGYFITGSIINNQDYDIFIKHLNQNGDISWSQIYDMEFRSAGNAITYLSDGTICITGYSNVSSINQDLFVMKINSQNGSEYWTRNIGKSESEIGHDILPSDTGGMFVLGETHSMGDIDGDIWILELDPEGTPLDTILLQIPGKQIGFSFIFSDDEYFTIAGETSGSSGVRDALIVQVDKNGNINWVFEYGGIYNDIGYSLVYSDYGWVLAGQTYSNDIGGGDAWIVKTDEFGNFKWMKTYGGLGFDTAYDIKITGDNGFIICGSTIDEDNNKVGWLIKTDNRGNYNEILPYP